MKCKRSQPSNVVIHWSDISGLLVYFRDKKFQQKVELWLGLPTIVRWGLVGRLRQACMGRVKGMCGHLRRAVGRGEGRRFVGKTEVS
jgi:hypothetical protein